MTIAESRHALSGPRLAGRSAIICCLFLSLFFTILLSPGNALAAPIVRIEQGLIQGQESPEGNDALYYGIPFAKPPVGELRWQPPKPADPWNGVRHATQPASACPQNDYQWNARYLTHLSEDCLTLNIRTPIASHQKLPVMVWIHGGSNRAGGASDSITSSITNQGVVLVSIQYRLGILGFLSHPALNAEQDGSSGNYGLMDQIAALRWVQNNIAQFGGDPNNVTIFGESAGSQDVSLLLASPLSQGLFHKAIMQSGTPGFGMPFRPLSEAQKIGQRLDAIIGTSTGLAGLRAAPIDALLAADLKLEDTRLWSQDFLWLRTTIDGHVLPSSPVELYRNAKPIPVILGTNRFEFGPSPGSVVLNDYVAHWFGKSAEKALRLYVTEENDAKTSRLGPIEGRISTDGMFRCPANHLANLLAQLGWPTWRFEFDVGRLPSSDGAILIQHTEGLTSHAAEIEYVFNRIPLGESDAPTFMQDHWVQFAKSGSPDANDRTWPRFRKVSKKYAFFNRDGFSVRRRLRPQHCALTTHI
jgi:para-nitrobenzyl esterase